MMLKTYFSCIRNWYWSLVYGKRGLPRVVNGVPFRVTPQYRWYFSAEYDPHVAEYLRSRVKPGMKCFNIGANLGVYALQFAHWTGPQGRVWAFEPNPNTARELENHIHMNGYSAICEIVPMAVSMEPGTAEFHISGTDGMSRLGVPNPELSGKTIPITVEVTTIDTFCAMNNVRPDVMMIDVEGFEIAALEGAVKLLSDTHPLPIIVIEMHPSAWLAANTTKEQFSRFLKKHDLQLVPLSGQTDPLVDYGHVALERLDNH